MFCNIFVNKSGQKFGTENKIIQMHGVYRIKENILKQILLISCKQVAGD